MVGIVALAAGGAYLLMHLLEGRVLHFEVVGLGVGVALLWERLTGRRRPEAPPGTEVPAGAALLLAIFGVLAIFVGLQGLVTPN